jgi:uncharacterized protein YacL
MEKKRIHLPLWLPITIIILFVLGFAAIPLIHRIFTEKQLTNNVLLAAIPFILIFVAIILVFIMLIVLAVQFFSNRVSQRTFRILEYAGIAGIVLGILGIFQPWSLQAYHYGFLLLLFSTLFYILWSHISPWEEVAEEAELGPESLIH